MAIIKGYQGEVLVDTNVIAQIREFTLAESVERMDATVMGNAHEVAHGGLSSGTVTVQCYLDPADTSGQGALVKGAEVTVVVRPDGTGAGKPQKSMPVVVETVEQPQNPREHAMVNFTAWINGTVDATAQT